MAKRGYPDFQPRIPPGWVLANVERWPINTMHAPGLRPTNWRFETYGNVKMPLSLSYDEFVRLPSVTKRLDHHCIDGWSYLDNEWTGVDMKTIIEMTEPTDEARFVHTEGEKGYSSTFPIEQELILAFKRNGETLPRAGGYPVRLIAPGEFGYKSVKWVERIRFVPEFVHDFWNRKLIAWGLDPIDPELHPWNTDNKERKEGLQQLFIHLIDDVRREKAASYLEKERASK